MTENKRIEEARQAGATMANQGKGEFGFVRGIPASADRVDPNTRIGWLKKQKSLSLLIPKEKEEENVVPKAKKPPPKP